MKSCPFSYACACTYYTLFQLVRTDSMLEPKRSMHLRKVEQSTRKEQVLFCYHIYFTWVSAIAQKCHAYNRAQGGTGFQTFWEAKPDE